MVAAQARIPEAMIFTAIAATSIPGTFPIEDPGERVLHDLISDIRAGIG